jgi:4-amino-4-deoxy-L-arabinose transferase-like glycosyltransferase
LSLESGLIERIKPCRQELLFLVLIIFFASIVRLWDLGNIGFNNDEAIYSGQAATLAGYKEFGEHFSVYRAHPLLLQFMISIVFHTVGISDAIARIVPALLGIFTIVATYLIGKILYDRRVAIVCALVLAILPYYIILSRQVLLDVSLTFFSTLTLLFMTLHLKSPKNHWLFLVGASAGLTFLSKEIGIFALIASIVCLFLIKSFSVKYLVVIISSFLLASSPYWIPVLTIQEARDAAQSYWHWQVSRDPNQPDSFYFTLLSQEALGYVLAGLFVLSVIYSLKTKNIKKPQVYMLLVWIAIPFIIIQFLAVKGFAFTSPLIPSFVLLGVSFLFSKWMQKIPHYRIIIIILVPLIFIFSGPILHYLFQIPPIHLVGSGGEPYVREASMWIRDNIPHDSVFLSLDTRTANVIKFYSNNDALALHANRNPAYIRIDNPDLYVLNGKVDYLVYEVYLAEQVPYLKGEVKKLTQLITKYNGIPIHTEYQTYVDDKGKKLIKPALIIYSLDTNK